MFFCTCHDGEKILYFAKAKRNSFIPRRHSFRANTERKNAGTNKRDMPVFVPPGMSRLIFIIPSYRPRKRQKLLTYFTNAAFWRYSALSAEALNISSIIWSSVYLLPSELVLSRSHCGVSISTKKFFILFLWN